MRSWALTILVGWVLAWMEVNILQSRLFLFASVPLVLSSSTFVSQHFLWRRPMVWLLCLAVLLVDRQLGSVSMEVIPLLMLTAVGAVLHDRIFSNRSLYGAISFFLLLLLILDAARAGGALLSMVRLSSVSPVSLIRSFIIEAIFGTILIAILFRLRYALRPFVSFLRT